MSPFREYGRRSFLPLAGLALAAYYLFLLVPLGRRAQSLDAIAAATVVEIGAAPSPHVRLVPASRGATSSLGQVMTLDQAIEESLAWLANSAPTIESGARSTDPRADHLTRREREVVALLTLGLTNRQVGEALVLTEGTVENYVQRILGKLGFTSRGLVEYAPDFQLSDGALYVYFRPKAVDAASFQLVSVESAVAQAGINPAPNRSWQSVHFAAPPVSGRMSITPYGQAGTQ